MKNIHQLLKEVTELTTNLETNYPELYRLLDENTLTLPDDNEPVIDKKIMENYLETLKQLLKHHLETHRAAN
jgi:translation initiation factor 2 alpha subunit (eIF-2alpha)